VQAVFLSFIYVPRKVESEEGAQEQGATQWETLTPYPSPFAGQDIGIFRPGEVTSDYKAVCSRPSVRPEGGQLGSQVPDRQSSGRRPVRMIRKTTEVLTLRQNRADHFLSPCLPCGDFEERRVLDPNAEIATGYSQEQALEEVEALPPVRAYLLSPDGGAAGSGPVARILVIVGGGTRTGSGEPVKPFESEETRRQEGQGPPMTGAKGSPIEGIDPRHPLQRPLQSVPPQARDKPLRHLGPPILWACLTFHSVAFLGVKFVFHLYQHVPVALCMAGALASQVWQSGLLWILITAFVLKDFFYHTSFVDHGTFLSAPQRLLTL